MVGPRRSSEALPEAQTAPKEGHGETITGVMYCQKIDEIHQKLRRICPRLVNRKGPILLHDNGRPHVSMITRQKLNELGYETLDPPPYSPDLSPTDYHFLKHLANFLGEKCFKNQGDAETAFNAFIASTTPDFYKTGIYQLVSACGSVDRSLDHRYWSCRRIRLLIIEAFSVLGRPPDLRAWIFGSGLEDDDLASAKFIIYRYFVQLEEEPRQPERERERDGPATAERPFVSHTITHCLTSPKVLTDGPHLPPLGMSLLSQVTGLYIPSLSGLALGFHRRVKAKTSPQDDDVPIDDMTTKLLFMPQEKRRKGIEDSPRDRGSKDRALRDSNLGCIKNAFKTGNRIILLHEFKLGHNAAETNRNVISAWGKGATSERTIRRCFEKILNGDISLGDEEGRGRPFVVDNDQLKAIIEADTRKTT
ncbi:hypothetical protein LAZ67_5000858 [Cordylochernes scorpioides]|uniref:Mos1 transposase HTH domain-containing protein n=1 Tax=Cordylochernes scorpioides TaxID=51811 RepID=A0ABY6KGB5_9ARAC|nr:hypothetical protein LAZ67_5000858 [Cordylochernes scorpioides]